MGIEIILDKQAIQNIARMATVPGSYRMEYFPDTNILEVFRFSTKELRFTYVGVTSADWVKPTRDRGKKEAPATAEASIIADPNQLSALDLVKDQPASDEASVSPSLREKDARPSKK